MMDAIDAVSWLALVLLPVWIAVIMRLFLIAFKAAGRFGEWGVPVYMAAGMTLLLLGYAVPAGLLMRQLDRSYAYDRCVRHGNAADPMNGCPGWTVRALNP